MITTPDGIHPRLGDERGIFHKKILGFASKVGGLVSSVVPIPGLRIASQVAGALAGTPRPTVPRTQTARVTPISLGEKDIGRQLKFGGETRQRFTRALATRSTFRPSVPGVVQTGIDIVQGFAGGDNGCQPPLIRGPQGLCIAPTSPLGASRLEGVPVLGQYGAGIVAGSLIIDRATCPRQMQLGNDGICYNKSQISNKQRMWPAGRKPLLTGGDMRAISIAARAGKRMEGATKRLQRMGMMKKPTSRRAISPREVTQIRHAAVLEAHAAGSRH